MTTKTKETVRGTKLGMFDRRALYLLGEDKCRHGSTGTVVPLDDFVRQHNLSSALLMLLPDHIATRYTNECLGSTEPAAEPPLGQPETAAPLFDYTAQEPLRLEHHIIASEPLSEETFGNLKAMSVAEVGDYFSRIPKGLCRQLRKRLHSEGHRAKAAAQRRPVLT